MASHKLMVSKSGKKYYRIFVSRGYGVTPYSMTWYVPDGWSKKAIESKLRTVEGDFESRCNNGEVLTRQEQKQIAEQRKAEEAKILTVRQYGDQVLLPIKETECSEHTRQYYKNILRTHIYPVFGEAKISDISTEQIKAFLLKKQRGEISQSTLTGVYITLGQVFKMAYDDGMIKVNPMDKVKKPKLNKAQEKDKEIESFNIEEMRSIIAALGNESPMWQAFVYLLIDTGMRRGEACGLKWKCVDFKNNTVKIETTLCYSPDIGIYEDAPKTEKSKRVIDVSPDIMAMLKKLSADCPRIVGISDARKGVNKNGYVFSLDGGNTPIHPDAPTRYFARFGKKYGIEGFHPHKLRHSFASIAITNGADVASVSEKLGHANKGITLKMYTHADAESMRRASNIFRDAINLKQA